MWENKCNFSYQTETFLLLKINLNTYKSWINKSCNSGEKVREINTYDPPVGVRLAFLWALCSWQVVDTHTHTHTHTHTEQQQHFSSCFVALLLSKRPLPANPPLSIHIALSLILTRSLTNYRFIESCHTKLLIHTLQSLRPSVHPSISSSCFPFPSVHIHLPGGAVY